MTTQRIFTGTANPANINRTNRVKDVAGFFVVAPDIADEVEIDFYFQVEVSPLQNRLIKLNQSSTVDSLSLYIIPEELQTTGLTGYGAFITTFPLNVEVWAIYQDFSRQDLENKLDEIDAKVTTSETLNKIITANQLQQNITLGIFATALSPLTFGGTAVALPALQAGSSLLLPFGIP